MKVADSPFVSWVMRCIDCGKYAQRRCGTQIRCVPCATPVPKRRKGRDPEKVRANSKRAYEKKKAALGRVADPQYRREWRKKNAEKLKAQRAAYRKTEAFKLKKRIEDAKRRRSDGATGLKPYMPRLHQAHVVAWTRWSKNRSTLHDAHVKAFFRDHTRAFRWRYRNDPEFRLAQCLRRQLRKKAKLERIENAVRGALRNKLKARAVERLLGYSMAELKQHLERQFTHGMTWDNYGKNGWHIDHVLPKRFFELNKEDELIKFWSLPNLRPLRASDNIRKHEKRTHLL